ARGVSVPVGGGLRLRQRRFSQGPRDGPGARRLRRSEARAGARAREGAPPRRRHLLLHGVHGHGLGDLPEPRHERRAGACGGAGALLEASPADLELRDGRVTVRGVPDRGVGMAEIAAAAGEGMLEVTEAFDPPGPTFSGAVHVASVEVDPETGRVALHRYVVV